MTGIDIAILVIIAVSALVSFIRGFFTEAISLITWIVALCIASFYAYQFGSLFREQVENDMARGVVAWLVLFVATLLIGALINYLLSKLKSPTQLGLADRGVGVMFGVARGILVVGLFTLAAHLDFFTSLREGAMWNNSMALPYFIRLAKVFHSFLPEREGSYFDFAGDFG